MATNKHALIRYKILDKCFRNPGKKYFYEDLMEECSKILEEIDANTNGISRRQILQDISFMESQAGWNIDLVRHRDGKRVYYRYADVNFSINNMPLNETEMNYLKEAIEALSQFQGMPQFEWLQELIPKLHQGIERENRQVILSFESNEYLKGIDNLSVLYNAIKYKKVLHILYKPFEEVQALILEIHPYHLKQYNGRWFLFGLNSENGKEDWNMALDRIVSIKETRKVYRKGSINWINYFEDVIGVTKPENGRVTEVRLQFCGKTAHYVLTKPLHGSQKSRWGNDDTLDVRMNIYMNYELERLILSYGESVKVISPKSLINTITKRLNEASALY